VPRRATGPIPVVLTVDLEPDGGGHDLEPGTTTWRGVVAARQFVAELRARAEARTGRPARFSWFLRSDPQIEELCGSAAYVVEANAPMFEEVAEAGDEVGLHIHGWRRVPEGGWVDDYADEAWVGEVLDRAFAAFAEGFGRPCRVASMGNRALVPAAVAGLARNGAAVDLSGEPGASPVPDGQWRHVRGDIPDHRRMPRRPHELAPGLVELPHTAARKRLGPNPRAHLSRMRRHGLRERLDQTVQLGGREASGLPFGELLGDALAHMDQPYVNVVARCDGLLDPVQRPRLVERLDALLAMDEADRFAFVTPTEAVAALGSGR
jgi:hypothetical protein